MTNVRPGRLAVRRDSSGMWRVWSPIKLPGYAGAKHFDGTYDYPFGTAPQHWEAAVRTAHMEASRYRDDLDAHAATAEPS